MSKKQGAGRIFVLSACLIWIPLLAFLAKMAYNESLTGDPETGRLYFTDIVYEDDDENITSLFGVITTFSYTFLLSLIGFWRKMEARSFQRLVCFSFVLSAFWTNWTGFPSPIVLTPP